MMPSLMADFYHRFFLEGIRFSETTLIPYMARLIKIQKVMYPGLVFTLQYSNLSAKFILMKFNGRN